MRSAVEHASLQETGNGWLLSGTLHAGLESKRALRFTLEISSRGEPLRLALRYEDAHSDLLSIRYGPARRFDAGRIPSWTEWKLPGSMVRLTIEDYGPADPATLTNVVFEAGVAGDTNTEMMPLLSDRMLSGTAKMTVVGAVNV